jgi:hypothetical protein
VKLGPPYFIPSAKGGTIFMFLTYYSACIAVPIISTYPPSILRRVDTILSPAMLKLFTLKGEILPPKLVGLASIYSYFFLMKESSFILSA